LIAASTTVKCLASPVLRYKTRVTSAPAGPTIERPGSMIRRILARLVSGASAALTATPYSAWLGGAASPSLP
jgi:hypothetical protein